jgi:hypothetical protein
MKNKKIWFIVIVLAIGFTMAACDNLLEEIKPTVTISGTPKVGETLIAKSDGNFTGKFNWQYQKQNSNNWASFLFDGKYGTNYEYNEIIPVREGEFVRAYRDLDNDEKTRIYSNILGPIEPAD